MIYELRELKGYEDSYLISNYGDVYSIAKGDYVTPHLCTGGYKRVNLSKGVSRRVHQLVAIAFLEHEPNGYNVVVDHIDGNKTNNKCSNLQLVSQRLNATKDINSKSNLLGAGWDGCNNRWVSRIRIGKKLIYLGGFKKAIDAHKQYLKARLNIDKYNGDNKEFRNILNKIKI